MTRNVEQANRPNVWRLVFFVAALVIGMAVSSGTAQAQQEDPFSEGPKPRYPEGEGPEREYDFTHPTKPWRRDHGTEGWRRLDQLLVTNNFYYIWWETANKKVPMRFPQHTRNRETAVATPSENVIDLSGVRGEKVSFQVAVSRRREQHVQVKRLNAAGLTQVGGDAEIPAGRVDVNQVGFVNDRDPDPLFPMPNGQPEWQDVPFGQNGIFWLTIDIPRQVEPGTYEGAVHLYVDRLVGGNVGGNHKLPIKLEVSPVRLPEETNVKTMNIRLGGGGMSSYARQRDNPVSYVKELFELLAENRMNPDKPWPLYGRIGVDLDREERVKRIEKWAKWWNDRGLYIGAMPGIHPGQHGGDVKAAVEAWDETWGKMIRENGWEDRCHVHVGNLNLEQARVANEMLPDIRFSHNGTGEGWSALMAWYRQDREQLLEHWIGRWEKWEEVLDIWNERPRLTMKTIPILHRQKQDRIEAGDEVTWYWHARSQVVQPALDTRDYFWRMFREDVNSTLYWGALMWQAGKDFGKEYPNYPRNGWAERRVWRTDNGFGHPRITGADIGNGCLMWPGREGPLSSIRLELYREGVEDFDLLTKLEERKNELKEKGGHADLVRRAENVLEIPDDRLLPLIVYGANRYRRHRHYQPGVRHQQAFESHREKIVDTLESIRKVLGSAD